MHPEAPPRHNKEQRVGRYRHVLGRQDEILCLVASHVEGDWSGQYYADRCKGGHSPTSNAEDGLCAAAGTERAARSRRGWRRRFLESLGHGSSTEGGELNSSPFTPRALTAPPGVTHVTEYYTGTGSAAATSESLPAALGQWQPERSVRQAA